MVLRNDGTVWTVGRNRWGQLGVGTTFHVLLPRIEPPALNLDFNFDDEPDTGTESILTGWSRSGD